MKARTAEFFQKHYLVACFSSVLTAALCVVLYPAEHGMGNAGRGTVVIGVLVVVALLISVIRRAVNEQHPADASGVAEMTRRMKKMGLIWYFFGALLTTSLIRIPAVRWHREMESTGLVDYMSVVLGGILLLFMAANAILLARSEASIDPPLK